MDKIAKDIREDSTSNELNTTVNYKLIEDNNKNSISSKSVMLNKVIEIKLLKVGIRDDEETSRLKILIYLNNNSEIKAPKYKDIHLDISKLMNLSEEYNISVLLTDLYKDMRNCYSHDTMLSMLDSSSFEPSEKSLIKSVLIRLNNKHNKKK